MGRKKKEGKNSVKDSGSKEEKRVSNVRRVETGISGFDGMIEGGFPENSSVLVCGGPGCGKTILAMQYLVNGALEGEKGVYVSFEQRPESLKEQAEQFGWDLNKLEKSGKLKIISIPVEKITQKTVKEIQELVKREKIDRLVIDSISTLIINAPIYTNPSELAVQDVMAGNVNFSAPVIGDYVVKRFVYNFIEQLRDLKCTTLLVGESGDSNYISRDTLSEFACDGVVVLSLQETLNMRRIQVRKLRSTIHPLRPREFKLTPRGIEVENEE